MELVIGIIFLIIVISIIIIIIGKVKGAPDPELMADASLAIRLQSEEAWLTRYCKMPYENQRKSSLLKMYEEKTAYVEKIKLEIVKREKAIQTQQAEFPKKDSLFEEESISIITDKAITEADNGDVDAQVLVGSAYLNGSNGMQQNMEKAHHYILMAAGQEHAFAAFILAALYNDGMGAPQDIDEARKWALKAKALGYPEADQMLLAINAKH